MRLEDVVRAHTIAVLGAHNGNRVRTAKALGMSIRWLQYNLIRWGVR